MVLGFYILMIIVLGNFKDRKFESDEKYFFINGCISQIVNIKKII